MARKIRNVKETNPELFDRKNEVQWDYEKNLEEGIDAERVCLSSKDKVHLYGKTCKHKFERSIASLSKSKNCPVCSGSYIEKGFNDFETWCINNNKEYLLDEWDYELNNNLPSEYTYSSTKKVHWKIRDVKYGKEYILKWKQSIERRTLSGRNCPYLSNQKVLNGYNDLKTWCINNNKEELLKEWNDKKDITTHTPFSNKKIKWKCQNCKNEWFASSNSRIKSNSSCPYCSKPPKKLKKGFNDFETWCINNNKKELLNYIDYKKNLENKINPKENFPFSHSIVYLKCPVCGYKWKSRFDSLSSGKGCPCCNNKVIVRGINDFEHYCKKHKQEFLLEEWNYNKNIILPSQIGIGSNKKISWKCTECGNEWKSTIGNRIKYKGCPECAFSKGEKRISRKLKSLNINYTSEYKFEDCIYKTYLRFDFAILKNNKVVLLIEYDGEQHFKPIKFNEESSATTQKKFKEIKKRDKIKNEYCFQKNIPLLRIPYTEFNNIEKILTDKLKEVGLL